MSEKGAGATTPFPPLVMLEPWTTPGVAPGATRDPKAGSWTPCLIEKRLARLLRNRLVGRLDPLHEMLSLLVVITVVLCCHFE